MICDSVRTDGPVIYNSDFHYIPCSPGENSSLAAQIEMLATIYKKGSEIRIKVEAYLV